MALTRWMPDLVRRHPGRELGFVVRALAAAPRPPAEVEELVAVGLRAAGLRWRSTGERRWEALLPWRTLVYGLIRRDVEERVTIALRVDPEVGELVVRCLPNEVHGAHAAGAGGVLVLATTVWFVGGWAAGAAGGLTTAAAGLLWTDITRELALEVLERRLRRLAEDIGVGLWPGASIELVRLDGRDG